MHAKFIKENSPCFYTAKMLDGTWIADLSKIDTLAKEMIEKIIENLVKQKGITEELKAKDQFAWIFDLEQIKHTAEELLVNDETFFISKGHLCRIFKEYTGYTLNRYITYKRLMYVRELVASGVSWTDAGLEAGFSSYSNFYKAYRRTYGHGPRG